MKYKLHCTALIIALCSNSAFADEARENRHDIEIEKVKISKRINAANIATNKAAIAAETMTRGSVDTALQNSINQEATTRAAADIAETTARQAANAVVQSALNQEAATRSAEDAVLRNALNQESTNRAAADTAEANARDAADLAQSAARAAAIAAEAAKRTAGDDATNTALQAEVNARNSADNAADAALRAETAARNTAVTAEAVLRATEDLRLQTGINSNATGISNNATDIVALKADINSINSQIAVINSNIDQANTLIAGNTTAINDANALIASVGGDVAAVEADLTALSNQFYDNRDSVVTTINNIETELANLNAMRETLAADLDLQLQALGGQANANMQSLVAVSAQVSAINSSMLGLNRSVSSLRASQSSNYSAIRGINNRLVNLESTVAAMQTPTFLGYANWSQDISRQSDAQQDAAMDSACSSRYPGSRAASVPELVSGLNNRPIYLSANRYVIAKMPYSASSYTAYAVSKHKRKCLHSRAIFPTSASLPGAYSCGSNVRYSSWWSWYYSRSYYAATRSTVCIK